MAVLSSPGVQVSIIDESFYNAAGQGTIPLILIATDSNKSSPSGTGVAPFTVPTQAGKLYLATSQRDLIQNFGNPKFYAPQGTPLHGYELNEYGLWAAYSYLGIASRAYILRADLDLAQLKPQPSAPRGAPKSGTYWLSLHETRWGVFRANGSNSPGAAWDLVPVKIAFTTDVTAPSSATFAGHIVGNSLKVSGTGMAIGQELFGSDIAPGTTITSGSGTTWGINLSQTVGAEFTGSIAGTVLTVETMTSGALKIGDTLMGTNITAGTTITDINDADTYTVSKAYPGGIASTTITVNVSMESKSDSVPLPTFGNDNDIAVVPITGSNYLYEKIVTPISSFTGSIVGTSLTSSSVTVGAIAIGQTLSGTGIAAGTKIVAGSGTSWTVSRSHTVTNVVMSGATSGWKLIESLGRPMVATGTVTNPTLVADNTIIINGVTVTIGSTSTNAAVAALITGIPNVTATVTNDVLVIKSTSGSLSLANGIGTPLKALGIHAGTRKAITRNSSPSYPDGSVKGSLWIKGSPANNGALWSVKLYNGEIGQWTVLTAPFFAFDSTLFDDDVRKDAAAILALPNPATGTVYVGFDAATGDQQLRRWTGSKWTPLSYEADFEEPHTSPAAGTLWYDTNLQADIMYGNGSNWLGYRHEFPFTDMNGPQIAGSAPLTQSVQKINGVEEAPDLVEGDLWIDSSDLENYPALHRWDSVNQQWLLIDNADQTTPYGIIFADARSNSGTSFTINGDAIDADYNFNSTSPIDMTMSDFVDPDAPDPRMHPAGMLLFNTRYSNYNIKEWQPAWFGAGGYNDTDYTNNSYNVGWGHSDGDTPVGYVFPALEMAAASAWVTTSGNRHDGAPFMGRKAQRHMVVKALRSMVESNQDIRSEIVFFNLMAAPGYPELIPDFVTLNVTMKQVAFCVADTPIRLQPNGTSIQNWAANYANASTTGEDGLTVGDKYTGIYYPWGLSVNLDGNEIMVPPSAIALVTIAYNDQVAYPWYPPAGFNRGLVTNASSVGYLSSEGEYVPTILNNGQRDILYTNRINPIAYIPNRGLVVFGQKTLSPVSTAMDRVNVVRLINYIAYHLDLILKPFLFELNTTATRQTVRTTVERLFNSLVQLNGVYDFAVVCDKSNNSPDRIDRNELWVDCAIQPVKAIEFIYVPVRILNTQATVA